MGIFGISSLLKNDWYLTFKIMFVKKAEKKWNVFQEIQCIIKELKNTTFSHLDHNKHHYMNTQKPEIFWIYECLSFAEYFSSIMDGGWLVVNLHNLKLKSVTVFFS